MAHQVLHVHGLRVGVGVALHEAVQASVPAPTYAELQFVNQEWNVASRLRFMKPSSHACLRPHMHSAL